MTLKEHLFRPRYSHISQKIVDTWSHASLFEKVVSLFAVLLFVLSTGQLVFSVFLKITIEEPVHAGELREGIVGSPRFMNPVLATSQADKDIAALVFSGLTRLTSDGRIVPDLAESVTVSEDGRTYTAVIREDARFHDGGSVIAADVIYTIERIKDPNVRSPLLPLWSDINVAMRGERILTFTLPSPRPSFMEMLSVGILPKHLWDITDPDAFVFHKRNMQPVGAGPFEFKEARYSSSGEISSVTLRASDENTEPYLQSARLFFYNTPRELSSALKRGRITSALVPTPPELSDSRFRTYNFPSTRVFLLFLNQRNERLSDASTRRNLASITPFDELLGKTTRRASSFIPLDILQGKSVYDTVSNKKRDFDEGFSVSITTPDIAELVSDAQTISKAWKESGVSTNLNVVAPANLMSDVIQPRSFEALLFGYTLRDPADAYLFWHSAQRDDPGLNLSGYSNENADELLESLLSPDGDRENSARELNEILTSDIAAIPLYSPDYMYIVTRDLKGIREFQVRDPSERFIEVTGWHTATKRTLKR